MIDRALCWRFRRSITKTSLLGPPWGEVSAAVVAYMNKVRFLEAYQPNLFTASLDMSVGDRAAKGLQVLTGLALKECETGLN